MIVLFLIFPAMAWAQTETRKELMKLPQQIIEKTTWGVTLPQSEATSGPDVRQVSDDGHLEVVGLSRTSPFVAKVKDNSGKETFYNVGYQVAEHEGTASFTSVNGQPFVCFTFHSVFPKLNTQGVSIWHPTTYGNIKKVADKPYRCDPLSLKHPVDESKFKTVSLIYELRRIDLVFLEYASLKCPTLGEAQGHNDNEKMPDRCGTYGELRQAISAYQTAYDDLVKQLKVSNLYDSKDRDLKEIADSAILLAQKLLYGPDESGKWYADDRTYKTGFARLR